MFHTIFQLPLSSTRAETSVSVVGGVLLGRSAAPYWQPGSVGRVKATVLVCDGHSAGMLPEVKEVVG